MVVNKNETKMTLKIIWLLTSSYFFKNEFKECKNHKSQSGP